MNRSEIQTELPLLALLPSPAKADGKTVRMCDTEQDAIAVSIRLSGLDQVVVAGRMGISETYLSLIKKGERRLTEKLLPKFCTATGWDLVRQYRAMHSAMRMAEGYSREADRLALIASYTQRAA